MHAGTAGAGKGKLANDVFGGIILGKSVPAFQLGRSEEEREKRIFSMLLSGRTIHSIDNLDQEIDSAALASLLTANVYQGRVLGSSYTPSLPARMTLVGTGNQVSASSEIARRVIPIGLSARYGTDEREDFMHKDLDGYVASVRWKVFACLLGMIVNWCEAGASPGKKPLGSFEGWARAVGGILATNGFTEWLGNTSKWRGAADNFGAQVDAFIEVWVASGRVRLQAKELLALATAEELFTDETACEPHKAAARFGKNVLAKLPDRPSPRGRVERSMVDGKAFYSLEPL